MKKIVLAAVFALFSTPLLAGGLDNPYERPPLMQPECRTMLGLLPCHEGFSYVETGGDDPTTTTTTTESEPPRCDPPSKPSSPKGKGKSKGKSKGNASANNGRGGNYGKTGHRDNGKGQGRNKR